MKRIIFIGILVSVFAFSGTAYAGVGALDLCIGEPDVAVTCGNDDGNECVYDFLTGVPAKKLNPNHWIVQSITTPPPEPPLIEAAVIGWFTSLKDMGGQAGFAPTLEDTFGCNCAQVIDILEVYFGYDDLDGQRKHGCTKSLIEDFIDTICSFLPGLCNGAPG